MNQEPTGIEAQVCADIAKRQAFGIAKYGVTVQDNPLELRQWLQHAYEECLDQAVYLRRAMHEMDTAQQGCDYCKHSFYAGTRCKNCGSVIRKTEAAHGIKGAA